MATLFHWAEMFGIQHSAFSQSKSSERSLVTPILAGIKFGGTDLVGLLVAISFAAGLNVYATVATLGLVAHARPTAIAALFLAKIRTI